MKKAIFLLAFLPFISSASFDRNLQYGSKGEDVTELQEFLTSEGFYSGPITGNFYALTRKALIAFQTEHTISPASGFFGPLTRGVVNTILKSQEDATVAQAIQEVGVVTEPVKESPTKPLEDKIQELSTQLQTLNTKIQEQTVKQEQTNQTLGAIQENTRPVVPPPPLPPKEIVKEFSAKLSFHDPREAGKDSPVEGNTVYYHPDYNGAYIIIQGKYTVDGKDTPVEVTTSSSDPAVEFEPKGGLRSRIVIHALGEHSFSLTAEGKTLDFTINVI